MDQQWLGRCLGVCVGGVTCLECLLNLCVHSACVFIQPVTQMCSLPNVFTGAVNFLRSLLEPDPVKRPNIQQALANRWLNENYMGKVPCNVTYPNR